MKKKLQNTLGVALAAALTLTVLSACGAGRSGAAASDTSAAAQTQAQAQTQTQASSLSAAASESVSASDALFSARDLSGEYDAAEAVSITLTGSGADVRSDAVTVSGSTVTITAAGTYLLSGTLDNGSVIVDAGKDDKVQLVLDGVQIHSDSFAAIYVKQADKVFVTTTDSENSLSVTAPTSSPTAGASPRSTTATSTP